jgi:hypothetical protein
MKIVRGLRNNNPLNIIKSNTIWLGQTNCTSESTFCTFSSMQYGFRAALKLLKNYYCVHHLRTIRDIVSRWAPETENKTEAYIRQVCRMTMTGDDTPLPPMKEETRGVWINIVMAMATVECGLTKEQREELYPEACKGWACLIG